MVATAASDYHTNSMADFLWRFDPLSQDAGSRRNDPISEPTCVYLEVYTNRTLTYERKAHSHAFNVAKVLHRDISAGTSF